MTERFTVSVALCTYNGGRYIQELFDSLRAQERLPDEVVICDDGSADDTLEIVERFAASAPFPVRVDRNEQNLGPTKNFEKTINLCTSVLIATCDQDDIWMPEKLARAAHAFEEDPDLGFTFSDAELIDVAGQRQGQRLWEAVGFVGRRRALAEQGNLIELLVMHTFVTGATMTFRADLRGIITPIPDGWFHDAWIALLGSFVRPYRMISEPLLLYRIHPDQQIGVPETRSGDGPVATRWTDWKLRLRQVPNFGGAATNRAKRRTLALAYEFAADRFATAVVRYLESTGREPHPEASATLDELRQRAEHLRIRSKLPMRRRERLPMILQEARTGRYGRYSAGMLSALQDLLY